MKLACKSALALAALLAGTGTALAESPLGQWNITFFNEPTLTPTGDVDLCFKADHTWYLVGDGFKGSWFGEGDEFRWYGTGGDAVAGHDHFIRRTLMSGVFDEFDLATGTTTTPPANTLLQRVKLTCDPPPPAGSHTGTGKFLR